MNPQDKATLTQCSTVYMELYITIVAIDLDDHHCILVMLPSLWECDGPRQRCLAAGTEIHRSERTASISKKQKKERINNFGRWHIIDQNERGSE